MMLGEVRDRDTALTAPQASQTGHLVLSPLHRHDTFDAMQRMLALGTHADSIAGELLCVIAQRLTPRICPTCRAAAEPGHNWIRELFPDGVLPGFRVWQRQGCDRCSGPPRDAGRWGAPPCMNFWRPI